MSKILASTVLLTFGYVRKNVQHQNDDDDEDNYPFVLKQLISSFTQKTIKSKLLSLKMELDLLWILNETLKLTEPKVIKLDKHTNNKKNTLTVFNANNETFAIYVHGGWTKAVADGYDSFAKLYYFSKETGRISIRSSTNFDRKLKKSIPVALKDMSRLNMVQMEVFHLVNYDPAVNKKIAWGAGRTPESDTEYETEYDYDFDDDDDADYYVQKQKKDLFYL